MLLEATNIHLHRDSRTTSGPPCRLWETLSYILFLPFSKEKLTFKLISKLTLILKKLAMTHSCFQSTHYFEGHRYLYSSSLAKLFLFSLYSTIGKWFVAYFYVILVAKNVFHNKENRILNRRCFYSTS